MCENDKFYYSQWETEQEMNASQTEMHIIKRQRQTPDRIVKQTNKEKKMFNNDSH